MIARVFFGVLVAVGLVSPAYAAPAAHIGDRATAFTAAWGKPALQPNGDYGWNRCGAGTTYQRSASVLAGRVVDITWHQCGSTPLTAAQMRAMVVPVLPADVRYVPAVPEGTAYHSTLLRVSGIPAAFYLGCNWAAVPPGTLWIGTGRDRSWVSVLIGVGCPN